MTPIRQRWLAALLGLALAPGLGLAQQVLPAPLTGGPSSDVPVAVQSLRWHMLDNDVSSLTFHSMDSPSLVVRGPGQSTGTGVSSPWTL